MVSVRPSYGAYLDEYYGLSTDTKPTHDNVVNGSTFVEIDTSREFRYDRQYRRWYEYGEVPDSSGDSSGGADITIIPLSMSQDVPFIAVPAMELFELCKTKNVMLYSNEVNDETIDAFTHVNAFMTDNAGTYYFRVNSGGFTLYAESGSEYPFVRTDFNGDDTIYESAFNHV